jgi:hypothetical protein
MSYEVKPVELFIRVPRQKREGKPMAKTPRKTTKKAEPAPPQKSHSPATIALGIGLAIVALLGLWQGKEEIDSYIRSNYTQKLVDDATTPAGTAEEIIATEPPAEEIQVVEPEKRPDDLAQVLEIRRLYLRATRADGKVELRTGGNASWRHHNPTRLIHGDYTRMMGAIGSDGKYAVFPSYDKGRKAAEAYLFTDAYEYNTKSLEEAFKDYALDDLVRDTGVSKDTKLKDLTPVQRSKLMDAIQKKEGWLEGRVSVFENETDWEAKGW